MTVAPGAQLGPYEITERLGAGGMGEVYKARDTRLNRIVAIKISAERFSDRFEHEARTIASLNHPNVCTLYDVGPNYLVMELVEGHPIEGPLPLSKVLAYSGQILDALDAAHRKGITHRDLKPANILVSPKGIKLLDFGLAKRNGLLSENDSTVSNALTGTGEIVGTLQYMAPEQLQGKGSDARTDLFAFGCVLYELISGKRAFSGGTAAAIIGAVLEREPDALELTPPLDRVLRTCLAKDPDQRFQNALDLKRALNWAVGSQPSSTGSLRRILPWVIAACLGVSTGLALWLLAKTSASSRQKPFVALDLEIGEEVSQPAVSRDASRVAFITKGKLAIRRLDQAKMTLLEGTEGASFPFFSSDGQWLAFFAGGKLQKVAVDGGAPVAICEAGAGRGGSWGSDDNIVTTLNIRQPLSRVLASGGIPQLLTDLKGDAPVTSHRWPQVLPDAKGILFEAYVSSSQLGAIRVLAPNRGAAKTLVPRALYARYGNGYLVYYQRGTLFAAPMDLTRLELTGPPIPLVDGVAYDRSYGAHFDFSSTGMLVYQKGIPVNNHTVSWLDSSSTRQRILDTPAGYWTPRLSPDGKRLALAIENDSQRSLWIYDLSRSTMTRLTFGSGLEIDPVWTPDGQFVAFQSGGQLASVRSDGSGNVERRAVTGHPLPTSFSPDQKWLAFSQDDAATGSDLWTISVERTPSGLRFGEAKVLLRQAGQQSSPMISPDGRWVAYESDETGRTEVYVMPFSPGGAAASGKWQVSNAGGQTPRWSGVGHRLFFRDADRRIRSVTYNALGESFISDKGQLWAETPLVSGVGLVSTFDVPAHAERVLAVFDAVEPKPEKHLRVLLNVGDELRRRTLMATAK